MIAQQDVVFGSTIDKVTKGTTEDKIVLSSRVNSIDAAVQRGSRLYERWLALVVKVPDAIVAIAYRGSTSFMGLPSLRR